MEREFTYTKERLLFILDDLLTRDIRGGLRYQNAENAEEGFEKRAAVEFVLWFLEEAFPEGFSFRCAFDELEDDYAEELVKKIAHGKGWSARHVREAEGNDNVVFVDFKNKP